MTKTRQTIIIGVYVILFGLGKPLFPNVDKPQLTSISSNRSTWSVYLPCHMPIRMSGMEPLPNCPRLAVCLITNIPRNPNPTSDIALRTLPLLVPWSWYLLYLRWVHHPQPWRSILHPWYNRWGCWDCIRRTRIRTID